MASHEPTTLEAVLRRDRAIVATALAAVVVVAWSYLWWLVGIMDHGAMDHGAMDHSAMGHGEAQGPAMTDSHAGMDMTPLAPAEGPWRPGEAGLMFVMWFVMMIGMMLPSATPMLLLYARVGRQAAEMGRPFAATGWFAAGYVAAWMLFSLVATGAQWALQMLALLTPEAALGGRGLGGLVLVAAGLYQFTPLKNACLSKCRAPWSFIQSRGGFRGTARGSLALGLSHGLYCVGCCIALMALLFVGGTMNLLWAAALAVLVLGERVLPAGPVLARIAGGGLVAAGVWLLAA